MLLVVAFLVAGIGLVRLFGEIASADSASKATQLARGISTAMNYGGAPSVLAVFCFAMSGFISLAGALQRVESNERG